MTLPDEDEEWLPTPVVYLQEEQTYGTIISYGAYVSKVSYTKDGVTYEIIVENDDIMDGD